MLAKYHMIVDFARPQKSNTVIVAENDVDSRQCFFRLLFDKAPFDMTGVVQATVMGVKGDQSYVYSPAEILVDEEGNPINELSWIIPGDITEDAGTVTLTITLADNVGAAISSFEFFVKVRNALYNEDDFIDDDDRQGFRDLLARCQAALERMEQMVEHDALPNPYPLKFTVDSVEYEYTGSEIVEIGMGDVAYLGEETGEVEITEDDSAAAIAVAAAESAQESATSASESLSAVETLAENLDSLIPTAIVTRDDVNKLTTVEVTDRHGTTVSTIYDGVSPVVSAEASVDGNTGTPSVTVTNTGTDEAPHYEFAFSNLKGAKGDPGSGVSIVDNLNSTSASDALSANMGHTLKGMVDTIASGAETELRDTVGWTGKNHLQNVLQNQTASNVTIVVGDDGVITLNGTASADSYKDIAYATVPNGDYTVSSSADSSMAGMYVNAEKLDGTYQNNIANLNNPTFTANSSLYKGYKIGIRIISGKVYSNFKIYPMLRHASISDSTYEPYHESVQQVLRDSEVIEGKNLADISPASNYTYRGIDYTVQKNSDGQVTEIDVNGTASPDVSIVTYNFPLKAGHYIVSGCPANGSDSSYRLDIRAKDGAGWSTAGTVIDKGDGCEFTLPSDEVVCFYIRMATGYAANHIKFHPMIRLATESDPTFEPYYIPLKDSKFDRSEQAVLGAKNRLPYPFRNTTKTVSGITFTDNGDGSITINGTSTADADFALWGAWGSLSYLLSSGRYTLTFGVGESSALTCFAVYNSTTIATGYPDISAINAPNGISNILLRVPANKTLSNLKVYPMLRLASDPDDTYVPYAMTNKELTDRKMSYADNNILGAKNRFSLNVTRVKTLNASGTWAGNVYTHNGVTFSINDDLTITVNGTASGGNAQIFLESGMTEFSNMILNGNPLSSSDSYYAIELKTSPYTNFASAYSDSDVVISNVTGESYFIIRILNGKSVTNKKISPMIRLASDPNDTYVPYAKTNKELTDEQDGYTGNKSPVNGVVTFSNLNSKYGYKLCVDIPDEASSTWPTSLSDLSIPKWSNVQRSTNSNGTINLAYTVTDADAQYCLRILK